MSVNCCPCSTGGGVWTTGVADATCGGIGKTPISSSKLEKKLGKEELTALFQQAINQVTIELVVKQVAKI